MGISGTTRLFGIIGDPIAHVRVPESFEARFAALGVDAVCVPLHVGVEGLRDCVAGLRAVRNLGGFVVTAPHKGAVLGLCDEVTAAARGVGAVNVVRRWPDGRLSGTILDGAGFVAGLRARGHEPRGKAVFIAGAGGAASAVGFALAEAGVRAIRVRNRDVGRAAGLAGRIGAAFPGCDVGMGGAEGAEIAVNATALGLAPEDALPFDPAKLRPGTLVAEVIMKPATTRLLHEAERAGLPTHAGRHMLDEQLGLMFAFLGLEG